MSIDSSVGKESTCNVGDPGLIPGSGRSPGEGIGYPLQCSLVSLVAQLVKNPPAMWETCVPSLGWEDPLEKGKVAAAAAKSLQSCPTLCDPVDSSPLGSPVPGILQARTLEWAAISFSKAWKWKVKVKSLSYVRLLATPRTAAYQAPPSIGFSRQEYWSGLPLPSPRERLPTPIFWPGEVHGLYSPGSLKDSDTTEWLSLWALVSKSEKLGCPWWSLGICNHRLYLYDLYMSIILFFTFFLFCYTLLVSEFWLLKICCSTLHVIVKWLCFSFHISVWKLCSRYLIWKKHKSERVNKALQVPVMRLINDILQIHFQYFNDKCW